MLFFKKIVTNIKRNQKYVSIKSLLFHKSDQKQVNRKILLHQLSFMNKCKTSLKLPFNIFRVFNPKKTISLK